MLTSQSLRTVTDMRKNADELLALSRNSQRPVGILKNNRLQAYLVDPELWETLQALAEDYWDSKMVSERLLSAKDEDFEDFEEFWGKNKLPK